MKKARAPFEPLGLKARWELVYEVLRTKKPGDVVTFADLSDALELDATLDRAKIVGAVPRAAKEFLETELHALEAVRNVGYRVVQPAEHLGLARKHQKRSQRSLVKGHAKVTHVDLSKLDPTARAAFEQVGQAFALQMQFNKRQQDRVSKVEELMSEFQQDRERSDTEVAELTRRLERLERLQKPQR